MPVPGYDEILDSEIDPGSPGTSSLFTRLRDNVLAIIGGGTAAPLIDRKAISAGGTGKDGNWINASTITGPGYFEPQTIVFSANRSLPGICVARCADDVSILACTITLTGLTKKETRAARYALRSTGGDDGGFGSSSTEYGGAGAGAIGDGGRSGGAGTLLAPGLGIDQSTLRWGWLSLNPRPGGHGGDGYASGGTDGLGGAAGGCLILLIEGDCDLTGATIVVDGGAGADGASGATGAGAGAGSIIIMCTGTLTGGTFHARGGAGASHGGVTYTGGGGGGYVALIASAFAGLQTYDVSGGSGPGTAVDGTAGFHEIATLTAEHIRGLMFRSY